MHCFYCWLLGIVRRACVQISTLLFFQEKLAEHNDIERVLNGNSADAALNHVAGDEAQPATPETDMMRPALTDPLSATKDANDNTKSGASSLRAHPPPTHTHTPTNKIGFSVVDSLVENNVLKANQSPVDASWERSLGASVFLHTPTTKYIGVCVMQSRQANSCGRTPLPPLKVRPRKLHRLRSPPIPGNSTQTKGKKS